MFVRFCVNPEHLWACETAGKIMENCQFGVVKAQSEIAYTMGCPSVRGDNPRALASGLSYVHVGKHGLTFYTTYSV